MCFRRERISQNLISILLAITYQISLSYLDKYKEINHTLKQRFETLKGNLKSSLKALFNNKIISISLML